MNQIRISLIYGKGKNSVFLPVIGKIKKMAGLPVYEVEITKGMVDQLVKLEGKKSIKKNANSQKIEYQSEKNLG